MMQLRWIWLHFKTFGQHVDIPIVAIGGINQENLLQLKGSGIDGIAVVSAIMAAEDIIEATKQLKEKTKELLL